MSGASNPATEAPAPSTISRTVAPAVLQQLAPSVRYVDPAQSGVIMESGTKSPTVSRLLPFGQRSQTDCLHLNDTVCCRTHHRLARDTCNPCCSLIPSWCAFIMGSSMITNGNDYKDRLPKSYYLWPCRSSQGHCMAAHTLPCPMGRLEHACPRRSAIVQTASATEAAEPHQQPQCHLGIAYLHEFRSRV